MPRPAPNRTSPKLAAALLTLALVGLGAPAVRAELCTIDAVPAATLLLPYFEVDLADPTGVDTLFSINNASAAPTLAHVVLWTDWSLPTLNFDVFLTGYDIQTVSLRDVFRGNLPVTAHERRDPDDLISPHGGANSDNPSWDSGNALSSCDGFFPFMNPALNASLLDRIQKGHTGRPLSGGNCLGSSYGANNRTARGYVTIDNASGCSIAFPNEGGYFVDGGNGIANNVNQLWGDWFIVDDGRAIGDNLVHIEADDGSGGSGYTFYGRYVGGSADDGREPLASTWATRYMTGGLAGQQTDLLVWRDAKCAATPFNGYDCSDGPAWHPLEETQIVAFNEIEDASELCGVIFNPPNPPEERQCFPFETQRSRVGSGDLRPFAPFGWLYLNLNHTLGNTSGSTTPCGTDGLFGGIAQSWVVSRVESQARIAAAGYAAHQLTSACSAFNPIIPPMLREPGFLDPGTPTGDRLEPGLIDPFGAGRRRPGS